MLLSSLDAQLRVHASGPERASARREGEGVSEQSSEVRMCPRGHQMVSKCFKGGYPPAWICKQCEHDRIEARAAARLQVFLDVVQMYRKEREISYEAAMDLTFMEFETRGWDIPQSLAGIRKKMEIINQKRAAEQGTEGKDAERES